MSKYDFEIDLSANSSTGIILNKIRQGSVVLEFGCATGRMTRYMKDVLGCSVYIVEYDREAYETAIAYAKNGLCDDILNLKWVEQFQDIRFDAIIFADVLEHLTAPEQILKKAAQLLADDGGIYVSIPNITHNDILLKAYEEHFDYTPTGILDDTHVHFWGLQNLEALAEQTGLSIRNIEATYCLTGETEQYTGKHENQNILLANLLKERACGEVYQFIVTLDKNPAHNADKRYSFKMPSIKSHIYFNTGNDFNADEVVEVEAVSTGKGSYTLHYIIDNVKNIKRIKFDPIEQQGCILRQISVSQLGKSLPLIFPDAVAVTEGFLLQGPDPMVYTEIDTDNGPVSIDADIVIFGALYLQILQDEYVHTALELNTSHSILSNGNAQMKRENDELKNELKTVKLEKEQLAQNYEECVRDLHAYAILANYKDKYSIRLEQKITQQQQMIHNYEQAVKEQQQIIQQQQQLIHYYENLKVVKLYARAARFIKRLLGKNRVQGSVTNIYE